MWSREAFKYNWSQFLIWCCFKKIWGKNLKRGHRAWKQYSYCPLCTKAAQGTPCPWVLYFKNVEGVTAPEQFWSCLQSFVRLCLLFFLKKETLTSHLTLGLCGPPPAGSTGSPRSRGIRRDCGWVLNTSSAPFQVLCLLLPKKQRQKGEDYGKSEQVMLVWTKA